MAEPLEQFWDDLLSEDPPRVARRIAALGDADRQAILGHLRRMSTEPGWSEGQRRRATSALAAWGQFRDQGARSPSGDPD